MGETHTVDCGVTDDRILLNVGGVKYLTLKSTFTSYPNTLLGALFNDRNSSFIVPKSELFLDRNGKYFEHVLDFYRTGKAILPYNVDDREKIEAEFDFFNIPLAKKDEKYKKNYTIAFDEFIDCLHDRIVDSYYARRHCIYLVTFREENTLKIAFCEKKGNVLKTEEEVLPNMEWSDGRFYTLVCHHALRYKQEIVKDAIETTYSMYGIIADRIENEYVMQNNKKYEAYGLKIVPANIDKIFDEKSVLSNY